MTGSLLRGGLGTNIYVSAVLSPAGPSGRVLQALHRRVFAAIKLRVWLERNTEVLKGEYQNLDVVPTDAKANPVAAAALESKAPYLVTQEATDLLSLKAFHASGHAIVQIVEPVAFLLEVLRER
jgi:predicted nucleic acid-binding protein